MQLYAALLAQGGEGVGIAIALCSLYLVQLIAIAVAKIVADPASADVAAANGAAAAAASSAAASQPQYAASTEASSTATGACTMQPYDHTDRLTCVDCCGLSDTVINTILRYHFWIYSIFVNEAAVRH